jgi:hypothetical protein
MLCRDVSRVNLQVVDAPMLLTITITIACNELQSLGPSLLLLLLLLSATDVVFANASSRQQSRYCYTSYESWLLCLP